MNAGEHTSGAPGPDRGNAPARRHAPPPRALPQFRVLLHNDDINELRYVVRTIIELTRMDSGRAMQVSRTAHTSGIALVLLAHKERAELYREQFAGRGLKISIEPA